MSAIERKFAIVIVNSIAPYCYELNNILALPNGFSYRFRYQNSKQGEWMPEIDNPKDLNNCDGLIVLREFQNTADLTPIRKINIYKVLIIGDIVYIEYRLKDKVILSSNLEERKAQIRRFNERITPDIKTDIYPNTPGTDLKNLVFFGMDYTHDFIDKDYKGDIEDQDSNKWGNIVELIGDGLEVYKDIDFIKITGIVNDNGKLAKVQTVKNNTFFLLENKRVYNLQFLQRTYTGRRGTSSVVTPRNIVMTTGSTDIKTIISRRDILGKYDLMHFSFKPDITSIRNDSFLMIEFERKNDDVFLPSITVPVRIRTSIFEIALTISSVVVFILTIILYWLPDKIVASDSVQAFRNILLPIMILAGGGTMRNIRDFILGRVNL